MNRINKIIYVAVFIFFLVVMLFYFSNSMQNFINKEPTLIIVNNTNQSINGLRVKYTTSNKEIEIPEIKPYKTYKYIISTDSDDSVNLIYTDKLGNQQKKLITAYITKGIKDTFKINIDSTNNGDIIINSNK